jgi:hypothetical protein
VIRKFWKVLLRLESERGSGQILQRIIAAKKAFPMNSGDKSYPHCRTHSKLIAAAFQIA